MGFYIWAASGTDDSAYHETLVQVKAMEQLTEGFPLAIALSEMGYNAFSIQYRTGGAQVACEASRKPSTSSFAMRRSCRYQQMTTPCGEVRLVPDLRHGFGLGIGTSAEGWEKDAVRFWEKYISRKNGTSYRK